MTPSPLNPNCAPTRVRPVHALPPRRYAGESEVAPDAGGGRPSVEALACRQMLREFRRLKRRAKSLRWQGGPPRAPEGRPLPEVDATRVEFGDLVDDRGRRLDDHGRPMAHRRSRFLGVYWDGRYGTWRARVNLHGRWHHAGTSRDEEAAARMRDALALKLQGPAAVLNFPPGAAESGASRFPGDAHSVPARAEGGAA